jgi:hypothetical protein
LGVDFGLLVVEMLLAFMGRCLVGSWVSESERDRFKMGTPVLADVVPEALWNCLKSPMGREGRERK